MQHYKRFKIGKYYFSNVEFRDLGKALLGISLAFAIARVLPLGFMFSFVMSLLVVGIAFVFHELAHKVMAQRYGCQAEFRSFDSMLLIAILLAFTGFIFIAPGAVMIGGRRITKEQNGKISAAGPLTNIILAVIFGALSFVVANDLLATIAIYGFILNSLLAVFNMLPFGNFDGRKILHWNKLVWLGMIGLSGFLFVMSYGMVL